MNDKQIQAKHANDISRTDARVIKLHFDGSNKNKLTHIRKVEKKIPSFNIRLSTGITPLSRVTIVT